MAQQVAYTLRHEIPQGLCTGTDVTNTHGSWHIMYTDRPSESNYKGVSIQLVGSQVAILSVITCAPMLRSTLEIQ